MRSLPLALSHPIGCSCRWIVTISGTVHRLSQNNRVDADDHLHDQRQLVACDSRSTSLQLSGR